MINNFRRYTFLVLCGKSKTRKTEFAKQLFGNPFRHKNKIDWSDYDWEEHGSIIYDDVSQPELIWKYVIKINSRSKRTCFSAQ